MPVLMRPQRLDEACSLEGLLVVPLPQQLRLGENAPGRGRADGNDILVEHHEGQAPIPFKGVVQVKLDDRLPLPVIKPEITRYRGIMLVGFPVPVNPGVELALADRQPGNEAIESYLGFL